MKDQEAANIRDSLNIHEAPEVLNSYNTFIIHEALNIYEVLNQPPIGGSHYDPVSLLTNEIRSFLLR